MISIDITFTSNWPYERYVECDEWLSQYPQFKNFKIDISTNKAYFDNEQDAMFFMLRWL